MTTSPSLRTHLVRRLRVNLTCAVLLLAAFAVTRALVGDVYLAYAAPAHQVVDVGQGDDWTEAASLISRNDCWTGEAPADMQGVLPGRVVATVDGDARVGGDRMVGKALEQIFDGVDHGLRVHAFCR